MAADQVEVMRALGLPRFRLAGHDRGGRVAHRLCLDHPAAVERVAVLDISPTRMMYGRTDKAFATAYYHWFFLIQPFDLPERLIGADPIYYLRKKIGGWSSGGVTIRPAGARRIRALLQRSGDHPRDLRGLSRRGIDRPRPRCGRCATSASTCPLLVLWGDKGVVHRLFDPIADWEASRPMCAAERCRRATISPRRRRSRRWRSCRHFLPAEPASLARALTKGRAAALI